MPESSARSGSKAGAKPRRTLAMRVLLRYGGIAIAAGVVLSGCIYASESFERFLIRDPRFFLPGPADYGLESPNLELNGVKYASRRQILRIFDADYGRSLYLFPLATRRKTLLGMRWVHNASVARIWPNRVIVQITRAQARGIHSAARREHGPMGPHRRGRRDSGSAGQGDFPASGSVRSDGSRKPGAARDSRAAHAAA